MLWLPMLMVRIANDTSLSILLLSEFHFGLPAFYRSTTLSQLLGLVRPAL